MIKGLAFVAYSVRDLPKAREFYEKTMGLPVAMTIEGHWVEFDVDGVTFGIGNGEPLGIAPGSSFSATFEVDDVVKEHDRLAALGVPVTPVHDMPGCYAAFVTDPEGNQFGLHQLKPRPSN